MASSVLSGFRELRQNLEITDLQVSTVSTRQESVRSAVANRMSVLDSFLVGSYSRSTMIAPLRDADIDIFVVLSSSYYSQSTPAGILDRVRNVLLERYPNSPRISRNGQAVTITFSDFNVDVVPAFYRAGGGFLIPDSIKGEWIETDPTKHNEHLTSANRFHGGDLVPLVKMMKGWNKEINDAFFGFYLELLTVKVLEGVTISDFPSGVRFVLEKGIDQVRYLIQDPAGMGGQVGGLSTVSNINEAVSRFTTAFSRTRKAEEYDRNGREDLAFDEWKKIFGNYFPAYR